MTADLEAYHNPHLLSTYYVKCQGRAPGGKGRLRNESKTLPTSLWLSGSLKDLFQTF